MTFVVTNDNPRTTTVLDANYIIMDTSTDYFADFPLGELGRLTIKSSFGASKVFFTVELAASEAETSDLGCVPSAEHSREHMQLVEIVDLCITYCLGASALYQTFEPNKRFEVSDDFELKLNVKQRAEGKTVTKRISIASSSCITTDASRRINDIERIAPLVNQCLEDANLRECLDLYREGKLRPLSSIERWYKIVEAHEALAERKLKKLEKMYLKTYAQIYRHHSSRPSNKHARIGLTRHFQKELSDPAQGEQTYDSYVRKLLEAYLMSTIGMLSSTKG